MTPVLIIAISLLGTIMMASLLALLLLLCTKRRCRKAHLAQAQYQEQDAELVKATWNKSHGELGLGGYSPEDDLPDMFLDPDWNGDAENVISDCIKLLKSCHVLTEQLVAYTMENGVMIKSPMEVNNIVTAAKNIRPRVDELVKAMYTPSDSKQIEEKSTALYKSVCKLLQVVQWASKKPDTLDWADEIILSIEKHMEAMQSGCQSMCSSCSSIQSSASSVSCLCRQPMVVVTNQAYCYSLNTPVC